MSNIAISDLQSTASSLENDDLLLISKKNGGTYTSMKMPGSVLKSGGTECLFTEDKVKSALTSYGTAKTSDVTSAKNAIQTSISSLNNLSSSDVKTACENAIISKGVSTLTEAQVKTQCESVITSGGFGQFIDPNMDGFRSGFSELKNYVLPHNSTVRIYTTATPGSTIGYGVCKLKIDSETISDIQVIDGYDSDRVNIKSGANITITGRGEFGYQISPLS